MPTSLNALLSLRGRFGQRTFRLARLVDALQAASPTAIRLVFWLDAQGERHLVLRCDAATMGDRNDVLQELMHGDFVGCYDARVLVSETRPPLPHALRVGAPPPATLPSGKPVAFTVPLVELAFEMLRDAERDGRELAYAVSLQPRAPEAALGRRLVPAIAELALRGRMPHMEDALRTTVKTLQAPGWRADEALLLPDHRPTLMRAEAAFGRQLHARTPFLPADHWAATWDVDAGHDEAARIHGARDDGYLHTVVETIAPTTNEPMPPPPASLVTEGDYVFLSYAHADRAFGLSVLQRLQQAGARVWYDEGLQAGTQWDQELERRIRACGALVACLTDGYQTSRFCTREISFADGIGKPILPIAPTARSWAPGLQLRFQSLQVCADEGGERFGAFCNALKGAAPGVFGAPAHP